MAMFAKKNCQYLLTNNAPTETLIQLLEEVLAMQERFEWLVEGGVNDDDANKKNKPSFSIFQEVF